MAMESLINPKTGKPYVKNVRRKVIEKHYDWGLYVYKKSNGKWFTDDEGSILNIPADRGDLSKISELRNAAISYGDDGEGKAVFVPGLHRISEEEYSEFIPQSIWDDIRVITCPVNPQIKTNLRSVLQIFGSFFISSNDSVTDFAGDGCLFSFDRGSRQSSVVTYWEKDANTGESKFSYN
jgi:hypothetical protein